MMLQNYLNKYKVNLKIQKKSYGNDSSDAIKNCFKIPEYFRRIKISTFECNFVVVFVLKQRICLLFFPKVHLA